MPILIRMPEENIKAVAGKRIRLNVQIEHPRTRWKNIKLMIKYNELFCQQPVERSITEPNDVGFSVIADEITIPEVPPTEQRLGEIIVESNGDTRSEYLPKIKIVSLEGYFEESVAQRLRELGFEANRWGGPSNPDVEAFHPDQPSQKYQVEATTEKKYDLDKYWKDTGKFRDMKEKFQFKRLLIVTLADLKDICPGVTKRLKRASDPFSLITYRDLQKLATKYTQIEISKYEVLAVLLQTGIIPVD